MFDLNSLIAKTENLQPALPIIGERCLQAMADTSPMLKKKLERHGGQTLSEYLNTLKPTSKSSYQSRQDFLVIYHREVASLLNESQAKKAAEELDSCPLVLTANHLGVDFFSQSVQSNLLFYLLKRHSTVPPVVVPVIACGSVPLNNITYPKGALLYKLNNYHYDKIPKKLPVFANKIKRAFVNVAPPFDSTMIQRAQNTLNKMVANKQVAPQQAYALNTIFQQDYSDVEAMGLPSYSRQSLILNNKIWQRLFANPKRQSSIVTLDMENIVSRLLELDLTNRHSLAWGILMDPKLRENVVKRLDNKRACWNLTELQQRLEIDGNGEARKKLPSSCGTVFFWGVDEKSTRIPLYLIENKSNQWVLKGTDDQGKVTEFKFSVDSIVTALKNNTLVPSIFTSYTVLSLARGLTCLGGYYQAEYLPMMQKEVAAAMRETDGYQNAADLVENVETGLYLSGMQTVMIEDRGRLLPAGPVEIIAANGLTEKDLDQIPSLTVREAHLASLFDTITDIAPRLDGIGELKKTLARECALLSKKMVVK